MAKSSSYWFVIDCGKVVLGPVSKTEATSWYKKKQELYKPEHRHNVVLIEGIARPTATYNCLTCNATERSCTKRVLNGQSACCETCESEDTHGFDGRRLTDLYTSEEIAALRPRRKG